MESQEHHGAVALTEAERKVPEIKFGPYTLVRRLAIGGMAEVYLARSSGLPDGELVVVKQILPQLAQEPELLQLFFDEARIASRIEHPGVIRMLDVGQYDGVHFLAMEYVDGPDLSHLMRLRRERSGAPLSAGCALRIGIDLARALDFAHELRDSDGTPLEIVHRDVSPQNVLISRSGAVKLGDFGIARARIRARKTQTGILRGKIAYVSPEQYLGQRGDRRVDVYAIGVVLFEAIAGRRPFQGEDAGIIQEVMLKDAPALLDVAPWVDERLSLVIGRALARAPEDRYPTAGHLADDLEALGVAEESATLARLVERTLASVDDRYPKPTRPARATMTLPGPAEVLAAAADARWMTSTWKPGDQVEASLALGAFQGDLEMDHVTARAQLDFVTRGLADSLLTMHSGGLDTMVTVRESSLPPTHIVPRVETGFAVPGPSAGSEAGLEPGRPRVADEAEFEAWRADELARSADRPRAEPRGRGPSDEFDSEGTLPASPALTASDKATFTLSAPAQAAVALSTEIAVEVTTEHGNRRSAPRRSPKHHPRLPAVAVGLTLLGALLGWLSGSRASAPARRAPVERIPEVHVAPPSADVPAPTATRPPPPADPLAGHEVAADEERDDPEVGRSDEHGEQKGRRRRVRRGPLSPPQPTGSVALPRPPRAHPTEEVMPAASPAPGPAAKASRARIGEEASAGPVPARGSRGRPAEEAGAPPKLMRAHATEEGGDADAEGALDPWAKANSPGEPLAQGELTIESEPWSHVYDGERDLGDTPLAHVRLSAGKHRLRLVNPDRSLERVFSVTIDPNRRRAVKFDLVGGKAMVQ